MIREEEIVIAGAGLVGSLLSILLRKKGFDVLVIEKRSDPRTAQISAGRSINLALSHRGIHALKSAGVFNAIQPGLIPMKGRMMHDDQGKLTSQPYGLEGQVINSVSRSGLNELLINQAEEAGVSFLFEAPCEQIDLKQRLLSVGGDHRPSVISAKVLIGADGMYSTVRNAMEKEGMTSSELEVIDHGYLELSIPPVANDFAMDPNHLHIWPRGNFMLIALPNPDCSFTCTLFLPNAGDISFNKLTESEQVLAFFQKFFPDVIPIIPDIINAFNQAKQSQLARLKSYPWVHEHTLLIGDAVHAIVPFYGQGMNAGFEDCRILMELAEDRNYQWDDVFEEFQEIRKKDTDAISDLAMDNFIVMRDNVSDDRFLERLAYERELNRTYPDQWVPLYSMVTFSDIPYSMAKELGELQRKAMDTYDWNPDNMNKIIEKFNDLKRADLPTRR